LYSEFTNEKPKFRVDDILSLEGNKLAMNFMPEYFLITDCSVKEAIEEIKNKRKKDRAIYETIKLPEYIELKEIALSVVKRK